MNDIVRRIRWGNLTRIAAVLFAVAIVVAWPKLKSQPLALPPPATVPTEPAVAPIPQAPSEQTAMPATAASRPERAPKTRPKKKRKRRHARVPSPTVSVSSAPPVSPPQPSSPQPEPKPEFEPFG